MYSVRVFSECWSGRAGNVEVFAAEMTSVLPSSSSSSSASHLCPLPSLIAAAAAAAATANVAGPSPAAAADFHYQQLCGHLLSLAGTISDSPSHAVAQPDARDFRYDDDNVGRKLENRPTAFERYHPYSCRR